MVFFWARVVAMCFAHGWATSRLRCIAKWDYQTLTYKVFVAKNKMIIGWPVNAAGLISVIGQVGCTSAFPFPVWDTEARELQENTSSGLEPVREDITPKHPRSNKVLTQQAALCQARNPIALDPNYHMLLSIVKETCFSRTSRIRLNVER